MSAKGRGVFITGTDTGVGKTRIATALIRSLVRSGLQVAAMKPVAAGAEGPLEALRNADALELAAAGNVVAPYERVNPYCFVLPASPHIAAQQAGISIDLKRIQANYAQLAAAAERVVVEGAGGWLAPISESQTMADIAAALSLPVILIVGMRLGCLNHALLTAEAIESSGLRFAGWVANHVSPDFAQAAANVVTLERRLRAPLLESVPFEGSGFTSSAAAQRLSEASSLW